MKVIKNIRKSLPKYKGGSFFELSGKNFCGFMSLLVSVKV